MKLPRDLGMFSFGSTSSTVTSLGLIFGFLGASNPRSSIIGALLVIAVADNISDSLGIHIYRETTTAVGENIRVYTLSNFSTRFGITFLFVLLFVFLPVQLASTLCIMLGLGILAFVSFRIGVSRKTSPFKEILVHLGVAIPVIIVSHLIGQLIFSLFP